MLFLVTSDYIVPDGCALCSPYCKKAKQAIFSIIPVDEVEVVEVGNQALLLITQPFRTQISEAQFSSFLQDDVMK